MQGQGLLDVQNQAVLAGPPLLSARISGAIARGPRVLGTTVMKDKRGSLWPELLRASTVTLHVTSFTSQLP